MHLFVLANILYDASLHVSNFDIYIIYKTTFPSIYFLHLIRISCTIGALLLMLVSGISLCVLLTLLLASSLLLAAF